MKCLVSEASLRKKVRIPDEERVKLACQAESAGIFRLRSKRGIPGMLIFLMCYFLQFNCVIMQTVAQYFSKEQPFFLFWDNRITQPYFSTVSIPTG